jgi:putative Holliday junction resolvase
MEQSASNETAARLLVHPRILAIDLGDRRMGLAVGDELQITAHGLPTAERRNKREDLNYIKSLAKKHAAGLIVLGHPLNMDGSRGPAAEKAERFAAAIEKHVGIPVKLWDERLTTVEADELLRQAGMDHEERKQRVDQMAARLILQSYLDAERLKRDRHAAREKHV